MLFICNDGLTTYVVMLERLAGYTNKFLNFQCHDGFLSLFPSKLLALH
jgi:hypothetical protein